MIQNVEKTKGCIDELEKKRKRETERRRWRVSFWATLGMIVFQLIRSGLLWTWVGDFAEAISGANEPEAGDTGGDTGMGTYSTEDEF